MNRAATLPKVFISHASEDKERFVRSFATRLRQNGIDAWYDKWEIMLGDSLVDRIFNEGIGSADAFLIVLSSASVDKPWVKAELDVGIVRRIEDQTRLIPIIIDACEIPMSLQATVWKRIRDLNDYTTELTEIIAAIFGVVDKPPIGNPPEYVYADMPRLPALSPQDSLLLKVLFDLSIEQGHRVASGHALYDRMADSGVDEALLEESFDVLQGRGYLQFTRLWSPARPYDRFRLTVWGFAECASSFRPSFPREVEEVSYLVINTPHITNEAITERLGLPTMVVNGILESLKSQGMVTLSKVMTGTIEVTYVSPELKRRLQ